MDFTKIIEIPKELQEELHRKRMIEIWDSGVEPVCANCDKLIDNGGPVLSCKARGGIIPREIAGNLSCVRNCHGEPDFKSKLQTPKFPQK